MSLLFCCCRFSLLFSFSHFHQQNTFGSSRSENTCVVRVSVCLSVGLCVCVVLWTITTGPISTQFCRNGPLWIYLCAFEFWHINIIKITDNFTASILNIKRLHCHNHSFDPIFYSILLHHLKNNHRWALISNIFIQKKCFLPAILFFE